MSKISNPDLRALLGRALVVSSRDPGSAANTNNTTANDNRPVATAKPPELPDCPPEPREPYRRGAEPMHVPRSGSVIPTLRVLRPRRRT